MWNSKIPWFALVDHPFPMAMGRCLIFNKKRSPICTSEKSLSANATDGIRPDMGISIKAGTFWPSQVLAIQKNFGWRFGVAIAATARVFSIIFYPLTIINHPFLGNWNFEAFPPPPTPPVQSPWSHRIAQFASHGLRCYSSSLLDFLSSAAMKNPPSTRFLGKIGTKTERK